MDPEVAAISEKGRHKRLEQQIEDRTTNIDDDRLKQKDNKKLQKLLNHYAIELDDIIVLKP